MKKIFIYFFLLLISYQAHAQTKCRDFYCVIGRVKANLKETAENKYQRASDNLSDAEAYILEGDIAKKDTVKKYRKLIFAAIEKERKEAVDARIEADSATLEADRATRNATALYWASEADKINPTQGMRLLEEAEKLSTDEKTLNFIQEQTKDIFNHSNNHQFLEKEKISSYPIVVSPDKKFVFYKTSALTKSEAKNIIWEIGTSNYLDFLKNEMNITGVFFSKNSKYLISKGGIKYKIWEIETGNVIYEFNASYASSSISDNGNWIIIPQNPSGALKIINISTGKEPDFMEATETFRHVKFSTNEKWLLTQNSKRIFTLWDVDKKSKIRLDSVKTRVSYVISRFSNDEKYFSIQSEYYNGKSILYNLDMGQIINNFSNFNDIAFSADNKWIVCTDSLGKVHFFDKNTLTTNDFLSKINTKKSLLSLENNLVFDQQTNELIDLDSKEKYDFLKNEKSITKITFAENKKWLFTFHSNNKKKLWSIITGVSYDFSEKLSDFNVELISIKFLDDNQHFIIQTSYQLLVWQLPILHNRNFTMPEGSFDDATATISNNLKYVCARQGEGRKDLYNVETNEKLDFLNKEIVRYVDFSPNDRWLFVEDEKGNKSIWNLEKGVKNQFFTENELTEDDDLISENGEWLVLSEGYKKIETGELHHFFKEDFAEKAVVLSPNKKWFFVETEKSKLKIYDVESEKIIEFEGRETKNIYYFSVDGNFLICKNLMKDSLSDYTFFDIKNQIKYEFIKNRGGLQNFEISPNSKWLQFLNEEYNPEIWSFATQKLSFKKEFEKDGNSNLEFFGENNIYFTNGKNVNMLDLNTAKMSTLAVPAINGIEFSKEGKYLFILYENKKYIETYDLTKQPFENKNTVFFNTQPKRIIYLDNFLYIAVGRSIVKWNPEYERTFFNYGDGSELNYEYEEIQEWRKMYGNSCLQQINQETIEKYGINKYRK